MFKFNNLTQKIAQITLGVSLSLMGVSIAGVAYLTPVK